MNGLSFFLFKQSEQRKYNPSCSPPISRGFFIEGPYKIQDKLENDAVQLRCRDKELIEIKLYLKEGIKRTLNNVIMSFILTSPTLVTLTLYPFGNLTNIGYGKLVTCERWLILKVI